MISCHQSVIVTYTFSVGASIRIADIDEGRKAKSKKAENDYHTKCLSIHNVPEDVLREIQRLPFPIQDLITGEASAMSLRIEKGKPPPELDEPECDCIFFQRYYVPCKHILHAHVFGNQDQPLLTEDAWKTFRHLFEESGMEVYRSHELMEIPLQVMTQEEVKAEDQRLRVNELLERVRNTFWAKVEGGNEEGTDSFIESLEEFVSQNEKQ